VFEKIGHFSPELYPNEENEWLDRAATAKVGVWYDPALRIARPQRASWGAIARMLVHYGVGRTRQFQVSRHFTAHQLAPLMLLAPIALLLLGGPGLLVLAAGWLAVALIVAASAERGLSAGQRLVTGLAAPFVPLLYAWGQLIGWFRGNASAEPDIIIVDERGKAVA
jgi:hypothetical protein